MAEQALRCLFVCLFVCFLVCFLNQTCTFINTSFTLTMENIQNMIIACADACTDGHAWLDCRPLGWQNDLWTTTRAL